MSIDTSQIISDNSQPGVTPRQNSLDPNIAVDDFGSLYVYESDVNRLARGVTSGTVIERRDTERRTNIRTGLSIDTWDEPESSYGTTYPHNRVTSTPNGFVEEVDDTPGNQRYHHYHPSGTYEEINANGTHVRKIVGDSYTIIENNGRIFIKGRASVTIENTCNILILGDANIEVAGKMTAMVKNDISLTASGSMNLNVGETLNVKAENIVMESTKFSQTTVGEQKIKTGSMSTEVQNSLNTKVGADYKIQSTSYNLTTTADANMNVVNSNIKASGQIKHNASGDASFDSDGNVKIGGSTLHLSAGLVKAATAVKEAIGSKVFLESVPGPDQPSAPSDAIAPSITAPDNTNLTRTPSRAASADSESPAVPLPNSRSRRIAIETDGLEGGTGNTSLYPGSGSPLPYTPAIVTPLSGSIVAANPIQIDEKFTNITTAPYEQLISKYVRLKDVSSTARARGHLIPDSGWQGLSLGEIVTNLQAISTNVIDKIIEKYGTSVIVTSGFRQERPDSTGRLSQHARGEAVDIQFVGLAATQYQPRYEEMLSLFPFDQFILEYQTGGNPWMHISFKQQGNRRQWFSMVDHRRNTPIYTL